MKSIPTRRIIQTLFIFCFVNVHFIYAAGNAPVIPYNLACELRINPVGIDVPRPGFSYILKTTDKSKRGVMQGAYQVQVSGTPDFKNGGDMWDSQKVKGRQMAYIIYDGKALKSGRQYWWKVRIWDQNGSVSSWTKPNSFTMGLLNQGDWTGKWISAPGAEKYALSPVGYMSADASTESETKWVQVDLARTQSFSEIRLYPMFYNDRAGYAFPKGFKLEASDDLSFNKPVTLADYSTGDFKKPYFSPLPIYTKNAKGRYIRLTVTKMAETGKVYAYALRQIEVISAGKNIAAGKAVKTSDSNENNGFSKNNLTDRVADYNDFPNYSSIIFRKEFNVKPELVRAVIHVSGLSEYELTINGQKIGNYLLTPGWTDYRKTVLYDSYDVTRQVKNGNNAIGVILGNSVYNIQPDTVRYVKFLNTYGPAKMIAQLRMEYADGSVQTIATDNTWQVATGPITYSNLYGGEDYDANLSPAGWDGPGFKPGKTWGDALETTGPGGSLKGLSCAAPPVTAIDTIKPVKITEVKKNTWIYDFGQNASMMPSLVVNGPKGSYIRMIPSELLGDDGLADRRSATQDGVRPAWWQYTLAGNGQEKWCPKFFYQGARYLQVELYPSANGTLPEIKELKDIIVHSSSKPIGSFKSSNGLFNQIYSLVRWAQRSNMMSLMTDCPHREKMGWLEENQLNGPALRYNFDMALLFRKTMNDMADAQLSNGLIPNIAPEYFIAGSAEITNGMRNSPEWGSSFIIVPWQQYLFSGDISLLKRYYDRMKKYVGFLSGEAKNNIIYTGLGDWYDIGPKEPWGSQLTPVSFTATAIYYYDNWIMHNIAQTLGEKKDAEHYRQAYEQIGTSFNNTFYKPETGLYATGSQTTSAMPIYFNIVDPKNRKKLLNALVNDIKEHDNSFTTGEVGYRFLLRALADEGRSDVVYEMNNQTEKPGYGFQIKKGATSLTEKWDAGVGNFGSQNHFMSGQINEWFFNNLVGLTADKSSPGFKQFIIRPSFLKDLKWVKGSYQSMSGNIVSEWKRLPGQLLLHINVPVNTSAMVYIPGTGQFKVKEGKKLASKAEGVKFIKAENGELIYQVNSGDYNFTIYNN